MSQTGMAWIVTIAFVALLVLGFFIGLWRGWKRSLLNFGFSVIGMIVAFFVTKPITDMIMNIQISTGDGNVTICGYVVKLLQENQDINLMMTANENFSQFIYGLPNAIASVVVFLIVTAIITFLIYGIYKITCIFVKYRPAEKKHRLVGAGINTVKVLLLSVIAFMPLISLSGLVVDMAERESFVVETSTTTSGTEEMSQTISLSESGSNSNQYGYIGEFLPDVAINIIDGVHNSLLGKVCGIGGLDDKMFDYYAQVEVDGEKVNVRQEVSSYYEVLALKYDIEHATNLSFTNINYEKLGMAIDKVVESPLFTKVVSTTLADMIINYKEYSFLQGLEGEYGEILEAMGASLSALDDKSSYFANDLKNVVKIFKTLGENGVLDELKGGSGIDFILQTLTDETKREGKLSNKESFDTSIQTIFKMNTIRDSISKILKKFSNQLIGGLDEPNVNTSTWNDEDWSDTATDISSFVKNYADLSKDVDFSQVLTDATILLDSDKDYNITNILSNLGELIDSARANALLKTGAGKSIFDTLLSDNNLALPNGDTVIKDADGNVVEIQSYSDLFSFISPSLENLKSSGIYDVINGSEANKIKLIAQIVAKKEEGVYVNQRLLNKIILPLNQVEPTKTLIMDNLTSSFGSSFVDLSGLNTFDEWNKDLGYISSLLIVLNTSKMPNGVTTYLDKVLEDKTNDILNDLTETQVEGIIKPILYAKATSSIRTDIMNQIATECNDLTGNTDTISLTGVTLQEGNTDDQANEICNVLKALIAIRGESGDIKDMNETKVKNLLSALQTNGYRKVKNSSLTSEGAFKQIFNSIMDKFTAELSEYDTACNAQYGMTTVQKIEAMCGTANYLQVGNYGNINFENVFTQINSLKEELGV